MQDARQTATVGTVIYFWKYAFKSRTLHVTAVSRCSRLVRPTYAFWQPFKLDEIIPNLLLTSLIHGHCMPVQSICCALKVLQLELWWTRPQHPLRSNSEKVLATCILQNYLSSSLWQCEGHCFDGPGIQRGIWNLENSALVLPHFQPVPTLTQRGSVWLLSCQANSLSQYCNLNHIVQQNGIFQAAAWLDIRWMWVQQGVTTGLQCCMVMSDQQCMTSIISNTWNQRDMNSTIWSLYEYVVNLQMFSVTARRQMTAIWNAAEMLVLAHSSH